MNVSMEQIEVAQELTAEERAELEQLERIIERGVRSFVEMGRALRRVQEKRLYRLDYPTFEAYLVERFALKRQRAYELIDAAKLHDQLVGKSDKLPERESHAAALAPIRNDAELMTAAWKSATMAADAGQRSVTADDVKAAVKRIAPAPEPEPSQVPAPAPVTADDGGPEDLRFAHIEEGIQILKMLPAPDRIVWPTDEGDLEAVGEAVEWLARFAPALARAWREQKRTRRRLHAV